VEQVGQEARLETVMRVPPVSSTRAGQAAGRVVPGQAQQRVQQVKVALASFRRSTVRQLSGVVAGQADME